MMEKATVCRRRVWPVWFLGRVALSLDMVRDLQTYWFVLQDSSNPETLVNLMAASQHLNKSSEVPLHFLSSSSTC